MIMSGAVVDFFPKLEDKEGEEGKRAVGVVLQPSMISMGASKRQ